MGAGLSLGRGLEKALLTQPIAEAVEPGVRRKSFTAEAVTALGVDVQFGGLAGRVPGGVEANAVSGRHEGVIAGTTDEERRRVFGDVDAT